MWRHILGLYRDIYCHQDDVFHGKSMVMRSRQCRSLSACATTAWFRRHVDVTVWPADPSPIENVWPIMKRRIRQQRPRAVEQPESCIK